VNEPSLPTAHDVIANLAAVRRRIAAAGRDPASVRIVAVTKGFPVAAANAAIAAGLVDLGENYADELVAKARELGDAAVRWHFQGALQTNKINRLAPHVACWQSLDSEHRLRALAARVPGASVLVQVDLSGSAGRGGCRVADVARLVAAGTALGLRVDGLMCVAPLGTDPAAAFAEVAGLADDLGLRERSMGMSDDFEAAVRCGATMIRLGSVLFGPRPRGPAPSASGRTEADEQRRAAGGH
jgi:hypothetical protein